MQLFTAILEDRFDYNDRYTKLSFELKKPFRIDFRAGQYLQLKNDSSSEHAYYFFSSPDIDHGFELLIDKTAQDAVTLYLENLAIGSLIECTAPYGNFVVDDSQQELILIATEAGIAPIYSIVLDLLQAQQSSQKITVYWGLAKLENMFLQDEFAELEENFPQFNFHPVLATSLPEWTLCRGTVYDCLSVHEINADAEFYICADQAISERIEKLCLDNGVTAGQLHLAKLG